MNECEFIVNIKTLLEQGKCNEALSIWNDDKYKVDIKLQCNGI